MKEYAGSHSTCLRQCIVSEEVDSEFNPRFGSFFCAPVIVWIMFWLIPFH